MEEGSLFLRMKEYFREKMGRRKSWGKKRRI